MTEKYLFSPVLQNPPNVTLKCYYRSIFNVKMQGMFLAGISCTYCGNLVCRSNPSSPFIPVS
jgi:hypothetical protein